MFNTDGLKRSLQELVKVKVVDKEREREEEEKKKRIAQKQQEERERKALELKQARKLAEEAEREENKEGYLIQAIEEQNSAFVVDLNVNKMTRYLFKDTKGNPFIFPKYAASCSYEDSVILCGGKGSGESKSEMFLSATIMVKYPNHLYLGPDISLGRFDLAITVVDHKLMLTGGFRDETHLAICERLNLKTMRKEIAASKNTDKPGTFGGNYERIANLLQQRSGHACCSFQNSCYVLCGFNWSNINSIERYAVLENEWKLVTLTNHREVWEKRSQIGAVQVDEKELVVYGKKNNQNRTFILRMEEKETHFHISSVAISREVPDIKGYRTPVVVNSKGCLYLFDNEYHLWRYQRDWQCLIKQDVMKSGGQKMSSQNGKE